MKVLRSSCKCFSYLVAPKIGFGGIRDSTGALMKIWLASVPVALLLLLRGSTALACGGLFCGAPPVTPAAPQPVDQNAERIIFEVSTTGTVTTIAAHVQISYVGGSDNFAWVVPVPTVPAVEDSTNGYFQALDSATALTVRLPQAEPCPQGSFSGGGGSGRYGTDCPKPGRYPAGGPLE